MPGRLKVSPVVYLGVLEQAHITENKVKNSLDNDADHFIVTPNGDVIDLLELRRAKEAGKGIVADDKPWKRRVTEERYRDHYLTLRTGVNYPIHPDLQRGRRSLENFFHHTLCIDDEISFQNAFSWILKFLGRLLIGGNICKEFVVFVGEKDSGKTTFVRLLENILGTYAGNISDDILYARESQDLRKSLYRLKDKRLLTHSEGTRTRKINTQNLKRATGGSSIPLEKININFTIGGKIVEDSNYIPVPDVHNDEAFNDRLVIIPFRKNSSVSRKRINELIEALYEAKEDIFALMVSESANSTGEKTYQAEPPICSTVTKEYIYAIRNPVECFYKKMCETTAVNNSQYPASEVMRICRQWLTMVENQARTIPYLKCLESELPIRVASETEFNAIMRSIHPHVAIRTKNGVTYTNLVIHNEWFYTPGAALPSTKDPGIRQKEMFLENAKNAIHGRRAIAEAYTRNKMLDDEVRMYQRIFQSGMTGPGLFYGIGHGQGLGPTTPAPTQRKPQEQPQSPKKQDERPSLEPRYTHKLSYSEYTTPYDLPEDGSDKKADIYITPYDLDTEGKG
jgi:energy-coupling factor transporter ATP-binding protein EcfA2